MTPADIALMLRDLSLYTALVAVQAASPEAKGAWRMLSGSLAGAADMADRVAVVVAGSETP